MNNNRKILLNDLLNLPIKDEIKVKFNSFNGYDNPLETYLKDPDGQNERWTAWRGKSGDFKIGWKAIILMHMRNDLWLLTSIREITGDTGIPESNAYSSIEIPEYKKYYGRIVIRAGKLFRKTTVWYETVLNDMEVYEILPEQYSGRLFPGVTEIRINLKEVINLDKFRRTDWIIPLENQKGIYLITDTKTNKKYVGSASGNEGLWQRWLSYVYSKGSGGNIGLEELLKDNPEYGIENFEIAVLETFGSGTDNDTILRRENWWKETLKTRQELNHN
ncbi:MAG: GIY-YIG nuclease family protein [Oxalobacter sp.]|nr:GIY-YIG nuclease family protein [Oxalobacter sp.]